MVLLWVRHRQLCCCGFLMKIDNDDENDSTGGHNHRTERRFTHKKTLDYAESGSKRVLKKNPTYE